MLKNKNIRLLLIVFAVLLVSTAAITGIGAADAPTESEYSDILSNMTGDGTDANRYEVTNEEELKAVNGDLDAHFIQMNDINASETENWNEKLSHEEQIDVTGGTGTNVTVDLSYSHEITSLEVNDTDGNSLMPSIVYGNGDNIYVNTTTSDFTDGTTKTLNIKYDLANPFNQGFEPIGNGTDFFTGSYDGNGYDINGLYINRPQTDYIGIFDSPTGNISNIFADVDISGNNTVGAIAGSPNGNISNVIVSGNISGTNNVGGISGNTGPDAVISNSNTNANISGDDKVGGIVGSHQQGSITTSYSLSNVSGNTDVGPVTGRTYDTASVTESYFDTNVTGFDNDNSSAVALTTSEMTGADAETNMVGLDFTSTWSTTLGTSDKVTADSYPTIQSVDLISQLQAQGVYDEPVSDSDGTTDDSDSSGGALFDSDDNTHIIVGVVLVLLALVAATSSGNDNRRK